MREWNEGVNSFYQQIDDTQDDAVILRVYGDGFGDASSRDTEFLVMQIAHAAGCFPIVHVSIKDGVVYKYAKGRVLGFKDVLKPEVIADITSKIYRLNHIDLESLTLLDMEGKPAKYDGQIDMISRIGLFIKNISKDIEDGDQNNRFQNFRQKFTNAMLLE